MAVISRHIRSFRYGNIVIYNKKDKEGGISRNEENKEEKRKEGWKSRACARASVNTRAPVRATPLKKKTRN